MDEAVRILDGVLAGLEAIHDRGIVHRDVKPSNVLLTASGSPKLADFGIAHSSPRETKVFDAPPTLAGTEGYIAPEHLSGRPVTPACDIYAAGRLLEALLGQHAPGDIREVVAKATAPDPADRWASASEMREALRRAAGAPPAAGAPLVGVDG